MDTAQQPETKALQALADLAGAGRGKTQRAKIITAIFESPRGRRALAALELKLGLALVPKEMVR